MTGKVVVLSTCSSQDEAERLGSAVVEKHLAACVTVMPNVTSIYRWKGVVEKATEWMLLIKTRRDLFDELSAELKRLHSYEVPEIIAFTVVNGNAPYLDWIDRETVHPPEGEDDPEPRR